MWFDETRELLGSVLRITFEYDDVSVARKLLDRCWGHIDAFQKKYSRFLSGTVLEQMNARIGEWQMIDRETFGHLQRVRALEEHYPLGFSLAVKSALERLGYDSRYVFEKGSGPVDGFPGSDFLLRESHEVFLHYPIEFGGFGKGYALDMAVETLKNECRNMCLDFGGDLYAKGINEKGERWRMVVESPFRVDEAIGVVELDDLFLATSNTLKRRWGSRSEHHHLIDPRTGEPANYWVGASVLAASGMEADFLATALFCTKIEDIDLASNSLSDSHFMLVDPRGKIFQHDFSVVLFSE